jgi:hypothetical protein
MADLTVTIKEDITLNGTPEGGQFDKIYTGIENVYKTWGTVPLGSSVNLYTTAISTWAGSVLETDGAKYARITNMSTASVAYTGSYSGSVSSSVSNQSILRLKVSGSNGISYQSLGPGDSFILTQHSSSFQGSATNVALGSAIFKNIESVDASAQGGDSQYHIFAAGVAVT